MQINSFEKFNFLSRNYDVAIADIIIRHLLEESRTLVVHQDDRSTDFLKAIYAGKGYPVISGGMRAAQLEKELENYDTVFCLGHGSPHGLFSLSGGYIIDDSLGPILAKKVNNLFIWCYASDYARRHRLSGIVSGMFISEVGEAEYMGIHGATQEEVDASNSSFSRVIRGYLDGRLDAVSIKQCYSSTSCRITQYNNDRLVVMQNGRDV